MAPIQAAQVQGKLNYPQLAVLCIVNFNEALQGNIIWPFIPFAVQRWGAKGDEVGMYVGVLASSFFLAQLLSVAAWGKASDKFGRRPTLLAGLLGTGLAMALFGFAESFYVALLARFLTGALNGNVAIAKTYVGEMCDQSTISRGFSFLSFCWGLGCIVAPTIGGYLAEPAEHYDAFKDLSFFRQFPYILPSLVSVAFSAFALCLGIFKLPETTVFLRGEHRLKKAAAPAAPSGSDDMTASSDADNNTSTAETPADRFQKHVGDGDIELAELRPAKPRRRSMPGGQAGAAGDRGEAVATIDLPSPDTATTIDLTSPNTSSTMICEDEKPESIKDQEEQGLLNDRSDTAHPSIDEQPPPATFRDVLRNRAIMSCIGVYGLLCIAQIVFDELFPVFLQTDVADGGLDFNSNQVGSVQIIAGFTQITCQLFIFPRVNQKFGPLRCFRHVMWPLVLLGLFPAIGRLQGNETLTWIALGFAVIYKTAFMTIAFTSIVIAINNSSRGYSLGLINGVAQSTASLVRTVGPALGGTMFSLSLHWDALGFMKLHMVYIVQGILCLVASILSFSLPKWIDRAPVFGGHATPAME